MRPIPLPDGWAAQHYPGATTAVFSAPNGDLLDDEIRPVEAVVQYGRQAVTVLWRLEEDDLLALQKGGLIALTMLGALMPHDMHVVSE